jgi:hypothetical protein
VVKVPQNKIISIKDSIDVSTFLENNDRGGMRNPEPGGYREDAKVYRLYRDANGLHRLEKRRRNGIPGATTQQLKRAILSTKCSSVRRNERGNIRELANGNHIVQREFCKEATVERSNKARSGQVVTDNILPIRAVTVEANLNP